MKALVYSNLISLVFLAFISPYSRRMQALNFPLYNPPFVCALLYGIIEDARDNVLT